MLHVNFVNFSFPLPFPDQWQPRSFIKFLALVISAAVTACRFSAFKCKILKQIKNKILQK